MKKSMPVLLVAVAVAAVLGGQVISRAQAQPPNSLPMQAQPAPMTAQQSMPMGQMMQQMQHQMAEMNGSVKALRAQLDKINPELLTGQERPMYDYLNILQTHLETMHGMLGNMMQMPGMRGR